MKREEANGRPSSSSKDFARKTGTLSPDLFGHNAHVALYTGLERSFSMLSGITISIQIKFRSFQLEGNTRQARGD